MKGRGANQQILKITVNADKVLSYQKIRRNAQVSFQSMYPLKYCKESSYIYFNKLILSN